MPCRHGVAVIVSPTKICSLIHGYCPHQCCVAIEQRGQPPHAGGAGGPATVAGPGGMDQRADGYAGRAWGEGWQAQGASQRASKPASAMWWYTCMHAQARRPLSQDPGTRPAEPGHDNTWGACMFCRPSQNPLTITGLHAPRPCRSNYLWLNGLGPCLPWPASVPACLPNLQPTAG